MPDALTLLVAGERGATALASAWNAYALVRRPPRRAKRWAVLLLVGVNLALLGVSVAPLLEPLGKGVLALVWAVPWGVSWAMALLILRAYRRPKGGAP
ncbi:MAG: hypothetical protein NZ951_02525 [Dehalococcoidia bacterium]|nr:hypothetical protein [Dehalococcoidia bacterium]MDW8119835.1 hypothetical protein [Chloroflexota bacterium]